LKSQIFNLNASNASLGGVGGSLILADGGINKDGSAAAPVVKTTIHRVGLPKAKTTTPKLLPMSKAKAKMPMAKKSGMKRKRRKKNSDDEFIVSDSSSSDDDDGEEDYVPPAATYVAAPVAPGTKGTKGKVAAGKSPKRQRKGSGDSTKAAPVPRAQTPPVKGTKAPSVMIPKGTGTKGAVVDPKAVPPTTSSVLIPKGKGTYNNPLNLMKGKDPNSKATVTTVPPLMKGKVTIPDSTGVKGKPGDAKTGKPVPLPGKKGVKKK
jgi:hypothetical protein